jgi:hypothetical protein
MATRWLVAKYMSDLRRRETRNVGVVLLTDDGYLTRFMGERPGGQIDGRRVKWGSPRNFKAWVDRWRFELDSGADLEQLTNRLSDANYFLEIGGERLLGKESRSYEDLLDYLYGVLVETPEPTSLALSEIVESTFHRLGIYERVIQGFRMPSPKDNDQITFDYRFDNGRVNLMQRVPLIYEDQRSWDSVHASLWDFHEARSIIEGGWVDAIKLGDAELIALVRTREEDAELNRQIELLRESSLVIPVRSEEEATRELGKVLGIA